MERRVNGQSFAQRVLAVLMIGAAALTLSGCGGNGPAGAAGSAGPTGAHPLRQSMNEPWRVQEHRLTWCGYSYG